jgi:hypothetical protein
MRSILKFIGILCCGAVLVFSCIRFYSERLPPSSPAFDDVYHFLHGKSPHPSEKRPFPLGEFSYNASYKLDTGHFGPTVYGTLKTLRITESSTEVVIVFYAIDRNSLPPISSLAPQPAIHVGQSVFPARVIRTAYRPGRERQYTFVFAPIGDLEEDSVGVYLDNRSEEHRYRLTNPSPEFFSERTGANVWGFLVVVALLFIVVLWPRRDEDSQDSFESRLWATWACLLLLSVCLLIVVFLFLMPKWTSLQVGFSAGLKPHALVSRRLEILEQGSSSTTAYMALAVLIGFSALITNLLLSVGHTRAVVRRLIRQRVSEIDAVFQERIVQKLDGAERVLQQMSAQESSLSEELENVRSSVFDQRESFRELIIKSASTELHGLDPLENG